MRRVVIVAVALAVAAACNKSSGKSPVAPTPQVTSIAVNGPDRVFLGRTGAYSATMTGGSEACSWGGDAPAIGSISPAGVLTGLGNGSITIWCDAAGLRGTKLVQVIANYAGGWIGTYRIVGCSASGDFASQRFCDEFPNDRVLPLSGAFTQSGVTVTGSFSLGQITAAPATTIVTPDGAMTLNLVHEGTGAVGIRSEWRVRQDQDGKMTGHVASTWTIGGFVGSGIIHGELFNTNRASAAASGLQTPQTFRTFDDVIRGMGR